MVNSWKQLDVQAKESATCDLRGFLHGSKPVPPVPNYVEGILQLPTEDDVLKDPTRYSGQANNAYSEAYGEFSGDELAQLLKRTGVPVSASGELEADIFEAVTTLGSTSPPRQPETPREDIANSLLSVQDLSLDDATSEDISDLASEAQLPEPPISQAGMTGEAQVDVIRSSFANMYIEYRASMERFDSLPQAAPTPQQSPDDTAALEVKTEYMMSKTQHQLTLEEGAFWSKLADTTAPAEDVECSATLLTQKSTVLFDSYSRRAHPPTSQTYDESKEIIRAMGVPYVEPDGPFEAEALAASMVLHGQADYVASEDTVQFSRHREDFLLTDYAFHRM